MKKFFISLFFLLVLCGVGFFFGWAQRVVPVDAYGLIRSKTHGIDTRLVIPGEFRWVWYKLIPTNTQTIVLRLNPVHHTLSAQNTLPSGNTYAVFAGIEDNFFWELRADFSFSLKPESIIPLVRAYNISAQEDLARIEQNIAGQIENFILSHMHSLEELLESGDTSGLEHTIAHQFPTITNFSLRIIRASIPDFTLYRQIKDLYAEYIAMQKEMLSGDLRERAGNRAEFYGRLGELELYGDLLNRYPLLLDFLALDGNR